MSRRHKNRPAVPPQAAEPGPAPVSSPAPVAFRLPQWPERACRLLVAGEFANHSCEVPEAHQGPHASMSVPQSVSIRAAWEKQHPELVEIRIEPEYFFSA
ncbi:hypothetical protein ACFZAM_31640 [Streptomyces sp. NPDC008079]|uniref:hypothetical protein n=1 Tax=Streptomyces sp. NPDC008079 TaxID=3364806 RepID=UPI0036E0CD13